MYKSTSLVALVLAVASGIAMAADVSKDQADVAIKQAKDAYNQVNATGFAWTDTAELIEAAEKAVAGGQTEDAVKLAEQARERSQLAYAQYEANKDADMESTSK